MLRKVLESASPISAWSKFHLQDGTLFCKVTQVFPAVGASGGREKLLILQLGCSRGKWVVAYLCRTPVREPSRLSCWDMSFLKAQEFSL